MHKVFSRFSFLLAAMFLASCGGGGGGGGGGGDTSAVAPAATTVTIYQSSASPTAPPLTSDKGTNALNWTNYRRAQIGLAAFSRNAQLDQAAAAHVAYMLLNNSYSTESHSETVGRAGFTGSSPPARTSAAGYAGNRISENITESSTTNGLDATDRLVDAPYHRQSQFGDFLEAGAASSTMAPTLYTIDFGGLNSGVGPSLSQLVVYPPKGMIAAPIDWFARETPNPVPDLQGQRVGYPVSIEAMSQSLTISALTLSDDKNAPVTGRVITTRTDTGASLGTYAFFVPLAPLAAGTTYTARAVGSLTGTGFDLSWSFTTAPITQLLLTSSRPFLDSTPGSSLIATVSGGTGRYLDIYASLGYLYTGAPPSGVQLFSVELVSPGVLKLVRNNTQCSGIISNCIANVQGQDSSGTTMLLNIPIH